MAATGVDTALATTEEKIEKAVTPLQEAIAASDGRIDQLAERLDAIFNELESGDASTEWRR